MLDEQTMNKCWLYNDLKIGDCDAYDMMLSVYSIIYIDMMQ